MRPFPRLLERAGRGALIPLAAAIGSLWVASLGVQYAHYLTSSAHPPVAVADSAALPSPQLARSPDSTVAMAGTPSTADTTSGPLSSLLAFTSPGATEPRVEGWVRKLSTSLKGDLEQSLDRMHEYAQMIDGKLDARGMPHDLIYLAMIESRFEPTARSKASAVGLWQFMASTARRFGLKVGGGVDQRKNPAASTDAALSYLSTLYHRFGSWYLAAAAYNSGEGTVQRALKKVTGRTTGTDADFFKILPALPKETRDYVPKLIATATIASDPASYGIAAAAH